MAALGHEAKVGAAKGHDAGIGVGACRDSQAIGPGAGAEDGMAGLGRAVRMGDAQRPRRDCHSFDLAAGGDRANRVEYVLGVRSRDGGEVRDTTVRRMQPGDPPRVGLELLDGGEWIGRGHERNCNPVAQHPPAVSRAGPAQGAG
jgi:hypothetical protein